MTLVSYVVHAARAVRPLTGIAAAVILIACDRAPRSDSTASRTPATAERAEPAPLKMPAPAAIATIAAAVQPVTPPVPAQRAFVASPSADLVVKRFVVATGVEDREPVLSPTIQSDASRVFAFAELANPGAEPQRVRVTFERKGSNARVGHAVLEVPATSKRYRTWGTSQHVKEPGEWEAVLWNERGDELARAPFAVTRAERALSQTP